jgi:hypothetical protein
MPILLQSRSAGLSGGDPALSLPGTGLSVPVGVEAIIEYNGLFFNDLSTVDRYRIIEIDGLSDADIRDSRDVNAGDHGETAFESLYGGRTVTLSGRIEAYTLEKMRDMQQALHTAFNDLKDHSLVFRTGNFNRDHQIVCRKSAPTAMRESQTDFRFFRDFLVTLRAADPRITSFRQVYDSQTFASGNRLSLYNEGSFKARPRIRVYGAATDVMILNYSNGQMMTINGTISAGAYYEIDTSARTMRDNLGVNRFSQLDFTSDWLELEPGENQVDISAASPSGTATVQITAAHTWI